MKLSRKAALRIHYILDQLLPPIVRDSRWLVPSAFRLLYKDQAKTFETFKSDVWQMTDAEFSQTYRDVEPVLMERETDLTEDVLEAVFRETIGDTVLEVGCGKGVLAGRLSETFAVTASDMLIDQATKQRVPRARFIEANAEALPFEDGSFDTVVCTHTLEHVKNLTKALSELRRVPRKKLVIVVPCQRPYLYTFDLHVHFFPYAFSLLAAFGPARGRVSLRKAAGDWLYTEVYGE